MIESTNESCRDPCGSRGSKSKIKNWNNVQAVVEILVDLVDLNSLLIQILLEKKRRDPCGSRGSKCNGSTVEQVRAASRSLWISWI